MKESIEQRSTGGIPVAGTGRHIGKIIGEDGQHLIQDTGRGQMIAHDVNKFDRPPKVGTMADIFYRDGLAKVADPLLQDTHSVGMTMDTR